MKTCFDVQLNRMVDSLVAKGSIMSPSVERAFRSVRRHRLLASWYRLEISDSRPVLPHWTLTVFDREHPEDWALDKIYSDSPLVTRVEGIMPRSSTSQPSLVAEMLESMGIAQGMHVLEIGTGTGYNAALLAELVGKTGHIWTVEWNPDVARIAAGYLSEEGYSNVTVIPGDGYFGYPDGSPFDRIVATAGCPDLSPHWLKQLGQHGQLLVPLRHGLADFLTQIEASEDHVGCGIGHVLGRSQFMPIEGALAGADLWRSYGIPGYPLPIRWRRPLPVGLPQVEEAAHSLLDPVHLAFHFYLSLASREHWYTNEGYGLADPGSESTVIVSCADLIGRCRPHEPRGAECLYRRLCGLAEQWIELGQPGLSDYVMTFVLEPAFDWAIDASGREWMIRRSRFLELIELASGDS